MPELSDDVLLVYLVLVISLEDDVSQLQVGWTGMSLCSWLRRVHLALSLKFSDVAVNFLGSSVTSLPVSCLSPSISCFVW